MRICLVGDPEDLTSVYVGFRARERGLEVLELPEPSLGTGWSFSFRDPPPRDGRLRLEEREIPFEEIAGLYVRMSSTPEVPDALETLDPERRGVLVRERRSALQHLLDSFPGNVANRPRSGRSNASKPYQMRWLSRTGFRVPRWVASNDSATVRRFVDGCSEGAIYKSCTGLRSRVRRVSGGLFERLEDGTVPVVVQEYVPGRDVRVHTVDETVFATEIVSPEVDYRFAGEESSYEATTAPNEIQTLCVDCARREGLTIAGIDFRVTDAGRWYCLEMNPVPTFLPYEMATEQPIADALLDRLARSAVERA